MKPWRIAENEWNLRQAPWSEAVGIEEVDDALAVPALLCWFTRPDGLENAQHVVRMHNIAIEQCYAFGEPVSRKIYDMLKAAYPNQP